MDFRIADTFTDSLARLTGDEQKGVRTIAFDLQMNPANPGMNFHRPETDRIAVNVVNRLGEGVKHIFKVA